MAKAKKRTFSKVQAVKANSRAVVGTPPPERVLPDPKRKRATAPRYKETLSDLLSSSSRPEIRGTQFKASQLKEGDSR